MCLEWALELNPKLHVRVLQSLFSLLITAEALATWSRAEKHENGDARGEAERWAG